MRVEKTITPVSAEEGLHAQDETRFRLWLPLHPSFGLALVTGIAVCCVVPFWISPYSTFQLTLVLINGIALLGLNLLTGYGGQISIGHGAFYALGAYLQRYWSRDTVSPISLRFRSRRWRASLSACCSDFRRFDSMAIIWLSRPSAWPSLCLRCSRQKHLSGSQTASRASGCRRLSHRMVCR